MKQIFLLTKNCILGKRGELFTYNVESRYLATNRLYKIPVDALGDFSKHFVELKDEKVFRVSGSKVIVLPDGEMFVDGKQIPTANVTALIGQMNRQKGEGKVLAVEFCGIRFSTKEWTAILDYVVLCRG